MIDFVWVLQTVFMNPVFLCRLAAPPQQLVFWTMIGVTMVLGLSVFLSSFFRLEVTVWSLIMGFDSRGLQLDRHPSDGALQSRSWRNYWVEEGVSVISIRQNDSHGRCLARLLVIIGSAATVGVWPIFSCYRVLMLFSS